MKTKYTIILLFYYLFCFSQTTQLTTADKKYDEYSYIDAIKIYEKVANKGYKSEELFKKLGNSYYFNGELDKATKWYDELFKMKQKVEPEYYFRYAQSLKSIKNYDEANKYLDKFNELTNDSRGERYAKNKLYLKEIDENSFKYKMDTTSLNSEFSDYGPAYFDNKIVFSSARTEGALYSKIHDWTNQNFTDLYAATLNENGTFGTIENFSKNINAKYNESTPTFSKDGKTMYFTRNNFLNGKRGKDNDRTTLVKIYKAEFINGEWDNIQELPFNSDNYTTAHPSLSNDGKTLYFASDMPGGYGGSDIYKVSINENSYGKPENLGNIINTEGRESFPFISSNNTLYFASEGLLGLGGLDVYESKLENGIFEKPKNLGKPINSSMDDFGLIIRDNKGFFSSNRDNGKGFDDIYSFAKCQQNVTGTITDFDTKEPLSNARVELLDENLNKINEIFADEKGHYYFNLDCNTKYIIRAFKEEYETDEKTVTTNKVDENEMIVNLSLKRHIFNITEGTDLAKIFDISIIYFDLDKWNIRPDAAKDIQKIIEVMKEYPSMIVEIRSHTDSRQTHKYNEILSDKRAKSTLEFMVKEDIERERLSAKGFGETQLVNDCADGVPCSEEEHQKNRRSEFIILKM